MDKTTKWLKLVMAGVGGGIYVVSEEKAKEAKIQRKKDRDSFKVMHHLIKNGYKVFPINPNEYGKIIFGEKCLPSLDAIIENVDMVDVFRANSAVLGVTKDAIKIGAKVLWGQIGVVNHDAARLAEEAGLKVVMNRCPKIELYRPFWKPRLDPEI